MVHLVLQLVFLATVGPIVGVALVARTGRLTWRRILFAATSCQWLIVVAYLATHGITLRVYGADPVTATDYWLAGTGFVLVFMAAGMVVAICLAPIARRVFRGEQSRGPA